MRSWLSLLKMGDDPEEDRDADLRGAAGYFNGGPDPVVYLALAIACIVSSSVV